MRQPAKPQPACAAQTRYTLQDQDCNTVLECTDVLERQSLMLSRQGNCSQNSSKISLGHGFAYLGVPNLAHMSVHFYLVKVNGRPSTKLLRQFLVFIRSD